MIPQQIPAPRELSYLGRPVRALQAMLRAIAEAEGDLPSVIPDGDFGADTRRAVLTFQRKYGLTPSGSVNLQTWAAIRERYQAAVVAIGPAAPLQIILQPNQVIRRGERNAHLMLVQAMLLVLRDYYDNAPSIAITGVYDDTTAQAVRWLRALGQLPQRDEFDKAAWQLLTCLYRITTGDGTEKTPAVPRRT